MKHLFIILASVISLSLVHTSCSNSTAQSSNPSQVKEEVLNQEPQKEQLVKISTIYGDMVVKLYNETPLHRDNFIKLAKEGYFDGTIFHRVIRSFMIQGGDPESKNAVAGAMYGNGGPSYTIPAEFNKKYFHKKGALAAARMGDNVNPQKASSGSQFYIVQGKKYTALEINTLEQQMGRMFSAEQKAAYTSVGGTPFLDMGYTVFGEVVSGLEVIDKIASVKTLPGDRPETDIKMTVSLVE
jgi:peptidyl-prolyl cis-trans isomerase B (cyclophilin B)